MGILDHISNSVTTSVVKLTQLFINCLLL